MKIFNKFQIEVYNKEEFENAERLGLDTSTVKDSVVDIYIDLEEIESFRETFLIKDNDIKATNIITKGGESYVLLISLEDFLVKYTGRFGEGNIRIQ